MSFLKLIPRNMLLVAVTMVVVVFLVGVAAVGAHVLQQQSDGPWTKRYLAIVPLPAAHVNGKFVLYRDVLDRWETVDRFLDMRALDTPQGQEIRPRVELRREAYEQLIRETYIESLAKQESFTVPQQVIENNIQHLLSQASSTLHEIGGTSSTLDTPPTTEEMNTYLLATFGWTFDQFRDRVLVPALREDGLSKIVTAKSGKTIEEWQASVDEFLKSDKVRRYLRF